MNFKKKIIAGTIGCAVISFPLFFAACGDDKSSSANDDEIADDTGFTLEELEELGIGIYESADEVKKKTCSDENEFETAYIKADSSFYVCYKDEWGNGFSIEPDILESKDDLGECNEENEGEMFRVPRDTIFDTYACENGEWISDFGGNSDEPVDPATVVKGTFTDERDGKTYKTVKIGTQTWMAENLNYKTEDSFCYDDKDEYCEQYGRIYLYTIAKNICPEGWRHPTDAEWAVLYQNMGNNLYMGMADPYEFNIILGGTRDDDYYTGLGLGADYWARLVKSNSLLGIKVLKKYQSHKRREYPWITAIKDGMYARCIKK